MIVVVPNRTRAQTWKKIRAPAGQGSRRGARRGARPHPGTDMREHPNSCFQARNVGLVVALARARAPTWKKIQAPAGPGSRREARRGARPRQSQDMKEDPST